MDLHHFPARRWARVGRGGVGRWIVDAAAAIARWLAFGTALLGLAGAGWAAEADPPGRVGRLALLDGPVSLFDPERGAWRDADNGTDRNRPLTGGDRLATGARARLEVRIGSTVLRLGERSELELTRLDDERLLVRLHRGSLAVRLTAPERAFETEVATGEARVAPLRAGLYRIDRLIDGERDRTAVQAWRGALRVDGGPVVEAGERQLLWREGSRLLMAEARPEADEFADWVAREDVADRRQEDAWARAGERRVSPELTGAEELDRHGRWERVPEYGWVWLPAGVAPDWAPYREGRWVWLRPWGWTWVDRAPWGFAPSHYGRWLTWRGRWVWWPGAAVLRPVFAPALVVWAGTPSLYVSVHVGGPGVGWAPLPPRVPYRPWYRHSQHHLDRVDSWHGSWGPRPLRELHTVPGSLPRRPIEPVTVPPPVLPRDRERWDRREDRGPDRAQERREEHPAFGPARPGPPAPVVMPGPLVMPAPVMMPGPSRPDRGGMADRLPEYPRDSAARLAPLGPGPFAPRPGPEAEGRKQTSSVRHPEHLLRQP